MTSRTLILSLVFVTLAGLASDVFSYPQGLKRCKVLSKQLTLRKGQKQKLTGTALNGGTVEYHIRTNSKVSADIRLTADARLKMDIYLVDPPTVIVRNTNQWSGQFEEYKEYTLIVNNCSSKMPFKYRIDLTTR